MKLYTKTGDAGLTGLIGGGRVPKDHPKVVCYGDVDELNAALGLAASASAHEDWRVILQEIQADLFVLGTQLATPDEQDSSLRIDAARVTSLERHIDAAMAEMRPLRNFVLPGGCELAARFHHARTVCRRAERSVVGLQRQSPVDPQAVMYLNRLSDLLFALALCANRRAGVDDVIWHAP